MAGGLGRKSPAQPPLPHSKAAQSHHPTARMACKAALVPEPPARSNRPGREGPAAEADARVARRAPQGRAWHWCLGKGSPAVPFEHHTWQSWFTERIQAQCRRCFVRQGLACYSFLSKRGLVASQAVHSRLSSRLGELCSFKEPLQELTTSGRAQQRTRRRHQSRDGRPAEGAVGRQGRDGTRVPLTDGDSCQRQRSKEDFP